MWEWGRVLAVSDRGSSPVGVTWTSGGERFQAVLKDGSGYHELPPIVPGGGAEQAFAINVNDLVVGQAAGTLYWVTTTAAGRVVWAVGVDNGSPLILRLEQK